jgi:UDP-N-acetylglucosamine enolpyruvyl transferase
MAATLAEGETVMENCAREPEVAGPGRAAQRYGRAKFMARVHPRSA